MARVTAQVVLIFGVRVEPVHCSVVTLIGTKIDKSSALTDPVTEAQMDTI